MSTTTNKTRIAELRADIEALECLTEMYEAGQQFIAGETDPEDAPDVEAMQRILDEIDALIQVEALEPVEPYVADPMEMMSKQPSEIRQFEQRYGKFGGREIRTVELADIELRDSGAGNGQMTVTGHAAVFNRKSLDLGGFQEVIEPGAFKNVLDKNPDVHLLWDHDTRYVLSRTANKTLDLQENPKGLRYWARVAPTSYAEDLKTLLAGNFIDQASFAFTVGPGMDTWSITEDANGNEVITRTIHEVSGLYDVTICAQGAYPQTDSVLVRKMIRDYADAHATVPENLEIDSNEDDGTALADPMDGTPNGTALSVDARALMAAKIRTRRSRINANSTRKI